METDTILNYTYSFLQGSLYFNCVCLGLAVISIILCIYFYINSLYLQPIITQYFISNKSEIRS